MPHNDDEGFPWGWGLLVLFVIFLIVINSNLFGNESRTLTYTSDGASYNPDRFITTLKVPTPQSVGINCDDPAFNCDYRFQGVLERTPENIEEWRYWMANKSRAADWKDRYVWHNLVSREAYEAYIAAADVWVKGMTEEDVALMHDYLHDELDFTFEPDTGKLTKGDGSKEYAPITGTHLKPDNDKKYLHPDVYMVIMMVMHRYYGMDLTMKLSADWAPSSLDEYTRKKAEMPDTAQTHGPSRSGLPERFDSNSASAYDRRRLAFIQTQKDKKIWV